ncbi:ganglioside GM2 activator-like [Mercenaria mercenaria]|uniref:ganglioside GM2 activator-like n=1 Tax=Mercenaria mercenaria TaxID=6596 RepID=UPI00234FA875|nr:ganglioside GM2 activator-like [Mercenaria mercenaria]
MFRFMILVASSLELSAAFQFTDCSSDPSYAALTVHQLDLSPFLITFPGDLHMTLNLTINKPINILFVDSELEKNTLGIWTKVPCFVNFGSCQNVDFCTILDKIQNGSSVLSKEFGEQIGVMLLSGLGPRVRCPIQPENLYINDYIIRLQPLSVHLSLILKGNYRIRISVKDDPTVRDNIGCIKFQAKMGVPTPGVG